jgi:hypothetical protein
VSLPLTRLARFFVLLSGQAHVLLPDGSAELWIEEGINGLMIAADVIGTGHYTAYPSDKETHALQIPFKNGELPMHKVLHPGTCSSIIDSGEPGKSLELLTSQVDWD